MVKITEPEISTRTIDTLGLTDLLGVGTSSFAGSPNNRIHNISVGVAKLNGILLKPGQEFSFIENIGEIEAAQGYLPELVIKNNKTIPHYSAPR
jgi:vancomycin resistance protein YoaR